MERYRTGGWKKEIEMVEIVKETNASVFMEREKMSGEKELVRNAKRSQYTNYFNTWKEAHDFLIAEKRKAVLTATLRAHNLREELSNLKGMKQP